MGGESTRLEGRSLSWAAHAALSLRDPSVARSLPTFLSLQPAAARAATPVRPAAAATEALARPRAALGRSARDGAPNRSSRRCLPRLLCLLRPPSGKPLRSAGGPSSRCSSRVSSRPRRTSPSEMTEIWPRYGRDYHMEMAASYLALPSSASEADSEGAHASAHHGAYSSPQPPRATVRARRATRDATGLQSLSDTPQSRLGAVVSTCMRDATGLQSLSDTPQSRASRRPPSPRQSPAEEFRSQPSTMHRG
jgi:hypothetical protein